MTIKFCGAAQSVTGSCHLLTLDNGYQILLDCGLYQGRDEDFKTFNRTWNFEPAKVDCVILSHAHIDHCGRLPVLVKDGFQGEIIATHATCDLAGIMLRDSAKIQVRDAEYNNKKAGRSPYQNEEAIYDSSDVRQLKELLVGISYDHWHVITGSDQEAYKVEVYLRDSGHILGSASVTIRITSHNGTVQTVGFTGDIGRPDRPILRDPQPMPNCDFLICESTYGDRQHENLPSDRSRFERIIRETCIEKKGKLLIPAFTVGRTQELIYLLDRFENFGKLPHIDVFVDSPMAFNATSLYITHDDCFDDELLEYTKFDPKPFAFSQLTYVRSVHQSKKLNTHEGPAIIISASGMANAGRIKHHLAHHIENPNNTVLIVGHCHPHTIGGKLRNGASKIRLFGETKRVNATIQTMDGFSAHADQLEMLTFLENQNREQLKDIFLVHGDFDRQKVFKEKLLERNFKSVEIPAWGDIFELV